jgi:AcrR family transcriptional regulator
MENYIYKIFSIPMREKIIETSLQQFLNNGIREMTMKRLVLALGISTKTMYKYFNNKEELLEECLKVHYSEMDTGISSVIAGSPNAVASLCRVYAKSMELDFGTNHLFYHDLNYYYPEQQDKVINLYSQKAGEILVGIIAKGITDGDFQSHLKPLLVLTAISLLYTSVTRSKVFEKFNAKPAELIKHTIDVYLRGICTQKGLQLINQLQQSSN